MPLVAIYLSHFILQSAYVINPIQSQAFRKISVRQNKTDSKDALIIALIMRFGNFSATNIADENIVALMQLSRFRLCVVDTCSDAKRRVIALLDQIFPEYETLFSNTFGVSSKEHLLNFSTPEEMMTISTNVLADLLYKASKGRFGMDKAQQIQQAASTSFGITHAKAAFAFQSVLRSGKRSNFCFGCWNGRQIGRNCR